MKRCPGDRLLLTHTCTLQSKTCLKRRKQTENEESGYYKLLTRAVVSHQLLQNGLWRPNQSVKICNKGIAHTRKKWGWVGFFCVVGGFCSVSPPPAALPVPFPGLSQPGLFSGNSILPCFLPIPRLGRRDLPSQKAAWKGANDTVV